MSRDYRLHLDDIIEAADKIMRYTDAMRFESFAAEDKTIDAVVRNLEIIGEASKSLPANVKEKANSVEWRKVIALRNILIHEYFGVNKEILWDIVQNKIPVWRSACESLRKELEKNENQGKAESQ